MVGYSFVSFYSKCMSYVVRYVSFVFFMFILKKKLKLKFFFYELYHTQTTKQQIKMTTIQLTPSQKNASQDAMRSLEEIKESLTSEQYRLLCNGLQVPFTMERRQQRKPNTEVWRCQVFQSVLAGFKHRSSGNREVIEIDANSCIDYDNDDFEKYDRIFFQPKLKMSYMNIEIRFLEVDSEDLQTFPPPPLQPVLDNQRMFIPVPSEDDYKNSGPYRKLFQEKKYIPMDDGTHISLIQKISETCQTGIVEVQSLLDDSDEE